MLIKYANDYGKRVVVGVVVNPDGPEYEHRPIKGGRDQQHQPPPDGLLPWEHCHGCVYLWKVKEFIFEGEDLLMENEEGEVVRKDEVGILADVEERARALQVVAEPLSFLVGRRVGSGEVAR